MICDYGCGREAKYQFKNGKWCCENHFTKCLEYKRIRNLNIRVTNFYRNRTINKIEIENKEGRKCDYGCNRKANYFFVNVKKYCCSSHYLKCPAKHLDSIQRQKPIEVITNKNCDFGCNKKANYILPISKKYCCSRNWAKCSSVIEKNSKTNKVKQKGENNARFGVVLNKETKELISKGVKKVWDNPYSIYHTSEYWINRKIGENVKPNKPEKLILEILNKLFPREWEFVGDYKVWIGGKNPDFRHKEKKLIIEHFGSHWHGEEFTGEDNKKHETEKVLYFNKFGYRTLVIWENELNDFDLLENKIISFVKE